MDDKELQNLLFSAIQHHNDTLLDDLLDGNANRRFLDSPNDDGNMLLHLAVIENHLKSVECLLRHGANPNVFDTIRARTPLHLAVELGQTDIVKSFLELDYINLNIRDDRNLTCYEIAQFCDNQELADLIKSRHDSIDQMKDDFYTVINQACSSDQPELVRELLVKYQRNILDKLPKGWISEKNGELFARSSLKELINWSSSSWNDVTLLFKSASKGYTEVCRVLIEFGATAKCNENTNYSPLYVAAYGGYTSTVRLLLENFPSLINEKTIEKWTVLHACCLQGHSETAKLILNYPYPEKLKSRFVSRSGVYEYDFAFDLNAQDAAGQTVIYLAVTANNEKLLDTLLHFNVEAKLLNAPQTRVQDLTKPSQSRESNPRTSTSVQHARIVPDRPKCESRSEGESPQPNSQLDKIIRQLCKMSTKDPSDKSDITEIDLQSSEDKYLICPFEVDTYCHYNSKTALHLAVCQQYHSIATTLLVNGANPNLPILSKDSLKNEFNSPTADVAGLGWLRSSKSTCLREASRLNDEFMCDILIRYGASDNQDNLALQVAASNKNNRLISKFLSLKSNVDPEYKINKKCNVEFASRYKQNQRQSNNSTIGTTTTTFSSMFPSAPVMIDWQNLRCIRQLDPQWFIDASLMHNKRLKYPTTGLMAITRLDLSGNGLKTLHPVIFRLPSLRELNLSKNRLESLLDFSQRLSIDGQIPTSKLIESHKTSIKRSKSSNLSSINLETSNIIDLNEPQDWDLPHLETLDLHDNRLISLPDCLFSLPRLSELDVSSNQIRQLPWSMWTAPALKELIASGNLLDDLPKIVPKHSLSPNLSQLSDVRDSPSDERSSMTSNLSAANEKVDGCTLSRADSDSNKQQDQRSAQNLDSSEFTPIQLESSDVEIEHLNYWKHRVELVSSLKTDDFEDKPDTDDGPSTDSKITYLNLSHNSFERVPEVLACLATELIRFNLSYNRIQSMGDIALYPCKIKNLDLSHNQISQWFTTYQSDENGYCQLCFADLNREDSVISRFSQRSFFCPHKQHVRLESLKSLNLSHNLLKDIQLVSPVNLNASSRSKASAIDDSDSSFALVKESLLYPNITALDLSFNKIQQVPKSLSNLRDLSVLNLSHNISISTLPAELGLASKLWNLSVLGCNMSEPLKSILESKSYKTMDIIGYLRSILEESKPYARMKLMLVGLQGIGKTSLLEQMRQEGTSGLRRHAPEHWTKRMGHATRSNLRNQKGVTLSTVGVDIHDWVFCKRTPRNHPNFGPVSFSTWDFGGQHEFYATHRYFLSRRSLYLVVWRLTDGVDGILGIQQWLVNIQSRASGSPVIIVGTHEDMIEGGEKGEQVQQLQEEVHRRFIDVSDHDKCGLPRVMDSVVVSTKTKLNIKNLCNRIYDVVFSLRCPGSTERLLEQKIPATYLYLEDIIGYIVHERHQKKREPVLTYEEYRRLATEQLSARYNKTFRDLEPLNSREINYNSELQQATRFLHENGVLLHYEDANLRDLYFLDPQWLCDILSHVVTVREINPHVKNGLMKIDDLSFLFKSLSINLSGGIQSYVVNLLNKFEVALTWNSQYLLIPSLLPADPSHLDEQQDFKIKMTPRMRGRSAVRRQFDKPNRSTSIEPQRARAEQTTAASENFTFEIEQQPEKTLYRLILLRYLPAGFLARLQSGILSEPTFDDVCADLHAKFAQEASGAKLAEFLGSKAGWTCWQHGIKLALQHESTINNRSRQSDALLTIEEVNTMAKGSYLDQIKFKVECVQMEQKAERPSVEIVASNWCDLDLAQYSNVIVVSVFRWRLKLSRADSQVQYLELEPQSMAKLLSCAVDHIDNLLEDWYPSLGTRFVHTLGGNYLVTRVVPCMSCFAGATCSAPAASRQSRADTMSRSRANKVNFCIESALDQQRKRQQTDESQQVALLANEISCFYIEHCIFNAYNMSPSALDKPNQRKFSLNSPTTTGGSHIGWKLRLGRSLRCLKHGAIPLASIAPDIVFEDVSEQYKIESDQIERCKLIGRGTFGFVFKGSLRGGGGGEREPAELGQLSQEVALKLLQPVDPGPEAEHADLAVYKSARANWLREPFHCACKSYCTARHEVNILQTLRHPNIVLFIGLCVKPLAIVLELAPMGCLTDVFKTFKRAGMRIERHSVQKTVLQVARALEFLHQQRVIYRDLKAENVLVWSFPSPFATQSERGQVELKLADYGISRQALSTGIWKGFAGTINFLAPEILRHNGDEEYTEKVDCFSFGMFMYELITLRPPFKHNEAFKNHLADGGRPTLSGRDLVYPNYMIDLMSVCWSQDPHNRPTASQIVSIASTPEFTHSLDVVPLIGQQHSNAHLAIQYLENNLSPNLDLWFASQSSHLSILSADGSSWAQCQRLKIPGGELGPKSCMCIVENKIWLVDSKLNVHVLPLGSRLKEPRGGGGRSSVATTMDAAPDEPMNRAQSLQFCLGSSKQTIKQMIYVKWAHCVLLLTSGGQLWQCQLESMLCKQLDDNSVEYLCMATPGASGGAGEGQVTQPIVLYCGQRNGISRIELLNESIHRQSIFPLSSKLIDLSGERIIEVGEQPLDVSNIVASRHLVWTSAGCTVHLWSLKYRCVFRRLDCWKLVPCSESLESINIENYYQQAKSSVVSSMVNLNNQLFVGTSHGCFMVIEADSLKPITVFRPYEGAMTILVPTLIGDDTRDNNQQPQQQQQQSEESKQSQTAASLVTIGRGYRDLMRRYVISLDDASVRSSDEVAILWSSNYQALGLD